MQVTYGYHHLETDVELRARLSKISKAKHAGTYAAAYLEETARWLDMLHSDVLDNTAWDIYDTQRRIIFCAP